MGTLLAAAFLIPLGLTLDDRAREEAIADAARRSALVTGALAVSTDPEVVARAVEASGEDPATRPVVHGLTDAAVAGRADDAQLARARAERHSLVVNVDGGMLRLDPVLLGEQTAVVEVFVPDAVLDGDRDSWLLLAGVAVALVGAAVLVVDRVAARTVEATRGLVTATLAVADGDLGVRVQPNGPRELAEAGHAFNRMAERLVAARTEERELVADLSHRLRTPLTVLRLDAEALESDDTSVGSFSQAELDYRRGIRRIRQAIVTLEGEIDTLIKTTRKAVTTEAAAGPAACDVSEVVRDRMVFWAALAGDQNRPHRVSGAQLRIPAPVARAELAAALDAVIGNVFRYTPQGTAFEVAVSRRDGYVAIRIDDAGPGIANPDRALRRGASDQGSTGLGLDIAKRVALQANGSVSIDRARMGGASVVMLLADPEATPRQVSRFGLVGRMAREGRESKSSGRRWPRQRPSDG
ncbi:two-component sensor histidine kinase [Micromonospora endophytica]|uniref:Signal transduction histidine-protein kinase/phosphatase MprB n=1 Tax=Micromonospora endophytica TaxID=515350 RepID=A0A2W2D2E6_9ACTN|nr:two-component sensor histidine kinase [Micromonospora endophytica]RIW46471.1 sensor histidine kinase [Micromonospora endophytica]BCJ57338.1 two-component sensor histidine kinase [Micromonospora endophytica]